MTQIEAQKIANDICDGKSGLIGTVHVVENTRTHDKAYYVKVSSRIGTSYEIGLADALKATN